MSVIFACTETTGFKQHDVEVNPTTLWRTPQSRIAGITNSGWGTIELPAPLADGRFRFYRRGGTWTSSGAMWTMYDAAGTPILRTWKVGNGNWRLEEWSGSAWVVLFALTYNAATIIAHEFYFNFDTEVVTAYYNDAPATTASLGFPHNPAKRIECHPVGGTGTTAHREGWTEFIVANNERDLNNCGVETKWPTANGTDTDGAGPYTAVAEAINDNGANVIVMDAAAQRRSFTSAARTGTAAVVLAVTVAVDMRYTPGDGTPTRARFYLKIGGVRYYSPPFALTEVLQGYQYAWNANPSTGASWLPVDANSAALEWGVESVA